MHTAPQFIAILCLSATTNTSTTSTTTTACSTCVCVQVKPGDRVSIVGVYKALAGRVTGANSGVFRATLVGLAVHKLAKEGAGTKYTAAEARLMKKVRVCIVLLSRSLGPPK
jgi:DNA replicative helicase MCM subunit Mcm2 (Cdc46/Mcm family)